MYSVTYSCTVRSDVLVGQLKMTRGLIISKSLDEVKAVKALFTTKTKVLSSIKWHKVAELFAGSLLHCLVVMPGVFGGGCSELNSRSNAMHFFPLYDVRLLWIISFPHRVAVLYMRKDFQCISLLICV